MIELKTLTKKFDNFCALDNIDLKIERGTSYGLLGSNGAGKSTILRILAGIFKQDEGTATIDGMDIYDNETIKEKVFFIDDETVQYAKYTLPELKNIYKSFYSTFSEEIYEKLLKKINLPLDKKIGDFSKGMKRQAIVIIGLACQTDFLLLDEAFDGLDPTMRIIVKQIIVDAILDRNLTTIISSHNLKEINEICDTVALIHKGKIVFNRQLDDVKGNIHKIQVAFSEEVSKEDFNGLEILHYEKTGSVIYMICKGNTDLIRGKLLEKNPLVLDIVPLSLEEIFIYEMEGLGYDSSDINK